MFPAGKCGHLLIALLVFLVVMLPLGCLFTHIRHDAGGRDRERLNELSAMARKALMNDGVKHQQLLRTWGKRTEAVNGPLDSEAWNGIFEGPKSVRLGRFRAVGYAAYDEEGRLVVRFIKSSNTTESIPVGTDLTTFPEIRSILEKGESDVRLAVVYVDSLDLPDVGIRNLVFTRTSRPQGEKGVIFATILAEDFLVPVVTVWKRTGNLEGGESEVVQQDDLPGVGEKQVRIELIPPGGRAPFGDLPEIGWNSGMGNLHLVFHPGAKFPESSHGNEAWIVLGSGAFVALLLSIIAWKQTSQRDMLQAEVAKRTAELRESNAELGLYKAIVETTSDLVGLCDMDGTPIFMNMAGRTMLGIGLDESLAAFPLNRLYPAEVLQLFESEGIPHAIRHGSWSSEIQMCHHDGHEIPVSFVGLAIKSLDGLSVNLGFIARDITARREIDRQLQESLANEREVVKMKSQFVNIVSHEFRTPLGVILSSADILIHYLDRLPAEQRVQHLNDIHDASQQMSRMLEQALSLGGLESGKSICNSKPLDLPSLLHRIVDENRSANGGNVVLTLDGTLVGAVADEGLLRHILLNLLSNARKYSADDAQVDFSATRELEDAIFVVRDYGIGIPENDLPHIFEAFTRASNVADAPGTGLGLAIVQRCVAMHGGTIKLDSIAGTGTTVRVRLPLFTHTPS